MERKAIEVGPETFQAVYLNRNNSCGSTQISTNSEAETCGEEEKFQDRVNKGFAGTDFMPILKIKDLATKSSKQIT